MGGVAASFIAYAVAKASSKEPHLFGTGKDDGIIASEAANNATCGGALIPALSLAIPGDPATAVLLGALILLGLLPGPMLFQDYPDVADGLFFSYLCANVFLLFVGLLLTPFFVAVLKVKKNRLIPIILLLSVVGTYAVQSSLFDIWSMWFFGLVGFFMRMRGFPLALSDHLGWRFRYFCGMSHQPGHPDPGIFSIVVGRVAAGGPGTV